MNYLKKLSSGDSVKARHKAEIVLLCYKVMYLLFAVPFSTFAALSSNSKFRLYSMCSFGVIAVVKFRRFGLTLAYLFTPTFGDFEGIFSHNDITHRPNSKKTFLAQKHVI